MKKIILTILTFALLVCALALCSSAATVYKDADGNEVFRYEIYDGTEESYKNYFEGTIKSYEGAFPNLDENGNALTWYIVFTETVGDDTVHTVDSFLTLDTTGEHATLSESGEYKYVNLNKELSLVSVYFPNDAGVVTLNLSGNSYGDAYQLKSNTSNLLFLTLPNTLTVLPQRIVQATPIIEFCVSDDALYTEISNVAFYDCQNLRTVDIPAAVNTIYSKGHVNDGHAFYRCVNLVEVDFAEGSVLETIQVNAFNWCRSLKEITLPNSVVNLGERVFQDCSSLETVRLGANVGNGLDTYSVQSLFYGCSSLKYVYFSETMVPTSGSHMFYSGTSGMVFFYTGNFEQYEAFCTALSTYGNNGKFVNAIAVEWDSANSDQYYKDLASAENKNYVVYAYGKCEAFYGGHSWKGETTVTVSSYFEKISIGDICANCGTGDVKSTIDALFVSKGISAKAFGVNLGLVQGYEINRAAIDEYVTYVPDFDFGILAYANKDGEAVAPKPGDSGVIDVVFDNSANSYVEIKVIGIPADFLDTPVVFCIYVNDGDKLYYLDNGETLDSVVGTSYSQISK